MEENGSIFRVAYYEAGDRRLARAGATLSRRMENGDGIWRLELPRLAGDRLELEQAGGPSEPPERIASAIPAFLRGSEPEPVVRLQVALGCATSAAAAERQVRSEHAISEQDLLRGAGPRPRVAGVVPEPDRPVVAEPDLPVVPEARPPRDRTGRWRAAATVRWSRGLLQRLDQL